MKFTTLFVALGLIFSAVAHTSPPKSTKRDVQVFKDVIEGLADQVLIVTNLVEAYSGGDAAPVLNALDDLISAIDYGTDIILAQPPLTVADGLDIVQPIVDLIDALNAMVDAIIAKEALFDSNGYADDILDRLIYFKSVLQKLADAITASVPAELADIAAEFAGEFMQAIQRAIDAYTD